MAPHFSEDQTDDFGVAVGQFRRALDRRVDAHLSAHPQAGVPHLARAAAPRFSTRPWALAVAVALLIVAIGGAIVWPRDARVYAAGDNGLQVTLADDSRVEMRAHSELTVDRGSDGIRIDLKKGDIIVSAAKQRNGHLYVHTKDMTISVVGTVFLVNAGSDGSRVAVIEGEVRVREKNVDTRLRPGEQLATSPTIARSPVRDAIRWSRNADAHSMILESFMKGMAQTVGPLTPLARAADVDAAQAPGGPVAAPAAVEFEEASIRACDPDNMPPTPPGARGGGPNSFYMTPGRTHVLCMTLATIVRTAYGLGAAGNEYVNDGSRARPVRLNAVAGLGVENGTMVRGGPDWVRADRYTIEATAEPSADVETMSRTMLRALLERRFRLKAHIEAEPIPAFTLSVSKSGLKMKPAQPGDCEELKPVPGQPTIARTLAEVRAGAKPNCGIFTERDGQKVVYAGYAAPMNGPALGGLVQRLALRLDRTRVIDNTGLTGAYTFMLEFFQDEATPPSEVWRASTLGAALEEQLGLTLESTTAPREFVVIDSVEQPGPN